MALLTPAGAPGVLHQVVACSAVVASCEDTVVKVGSTGDGAAFVALKDGLISLNRRRHWLSL